jgi:hypothetical protein
VVLTCAGLLRQGTKARMRAFCSLHCLSLALTQSAVHLVVGEQPEEHTQPTGSLGDPYKMRT